ncbi:glycosyltransferase [Aetokthonos hydrillicola Thurmond2011]|jgi:dolichyl-phosphate beta-glucosyltransferase|uniref:Glycosyltransferase n=1 Tax=Aetokthonos hydrillicola Thurmond2011 TaxID=2712845 RepID=A0AAP5I7J4_9CYAN|nr:glycosyltransferase [Aetokthonos hydrillicola]MBO3460388.1 glycosyltransferase [Aetokthonos hydrillicola CCALA 1050]MBW4584490.1 glycosyltransferase [Aetokthonos hydrillicola CCALA 1050]MDR9896453.1 glycosyltransferase [Aetokthonos hydrillicola Thurmond2011]
MRKVAVILPVYNEEKCIQRTLDSILEFSKSQPYYHFIFVNDGSTDRTEEILIKTVESLNTSQIKLISYQENKGKGAAIKTGLQYAEGDYICYIDSDLAYSLEYLKVIVQKLEYFDIVIGCRVLDLNALNGLSLIRIIAGKMFNLLSRIILDLPFHDMQAGIKGFKKDVAVYLFKQQDRKGFSFDVELIYIAHNKGYHIGEIPVIVSDDHLYKQSKVNLVKDSIGMFFSLLKIRFKYNTSRYPCHKSSHKKPKSRRISIE